MKKIFALSIMSIMIISCSNPSNENQSSNKMSPASKYVEYVWHSAEENFNAENLAILISKWNKIIDGYDCDMDGANILTPTEKRDNHDFTWVLKWPSVDARNSCWETWTNDYASDWDETISGIMSYDPKMLSCSKLRLGEPLKKKIHLDLLLIHFIFVNTMREMMLKH